MILVPRAAREVRVVPVSVNVAEVEASLRVPKTVLQLRSGDRLFRAELVFNEAIHLLPILVFEIAQEVRKVGERFRREERFRVAVALRNRNRLRFERLRRVDAERSAALEREVGEFERRSVLEGAERNADLGVGFRRKERNRNGLPIFRRRYVATDADRLPRIVIFDDADRNFRLAFGADFERKSIRRTLFDAEPDAVNLRNPRDGAGFFDVEAQRVRVDSGFARRDDAPTRLRGFVELQLPRTVELKVRRERAVGDLFGARRVFAAVPSGAELVGRAVFLRKPSVPKALELVAIRLRQRVEFAPRPRGDDRVFVVDFDDRDARVVDVSLAGVRVDVRQQVAGVLLLLGDHSRVEVVDALVLRRETIRVFEAVALVERSRNVQVNVDVNPFFLKAIDHVVELVELFRVDFRSRFLEVGAPNVAAVHMVQPNDADPEPRKGPSEELGVFFLREVGAEAEVRAEEARVAGFEREPTVFRSEEASRPGARERIVPSLDVSDVALGAVLNNEREFGRVVGEKRRRTDETAEKRRERRTGEFFAHRIFLNRPRASKR